MANADVPPIDELRPLADLFRRLMGACPKTAHRWRLHPTQPVAAWRVGREWMTTEAAVRAWIAARSRGQETKPSEPVTPSKRQREIDACMARLSAAGTGRLTQGARP